MDQLTVLAMFSWQYLLMVFLACLGIVQLSAARSGRRHLWLLPQRRPVYALGLVLLAVGLAFFHLIPLATTGPWGPTDPVDGSATWARASLESLPGARNINDTDGGLSGHWQALWFGLGWIGAVFFARAVGRIHRPPKEEAGAGRDERLPVGSAPGGRR